MKIIFLLPAAVMLFASGMQIDSISLSDNDKKLAQLINDYRKKKNLSAIRISKSLTLVAKTHCEDLEKYSKEIKRGCNPHSWSKHGKWTRVDYYPDHRNAQGMWDKPRELSEYKGNGYEIECDGASSPEDALKLWKSSPGHNAVIIESGKWKNTDWQSMGVCICKGFAVVWFGEEIDPAGYIK